MINNLYNVDLKTFFLHNSHLKASQKLSIGVGGPRHGLPTSLGRCLGGIPRHSSPTSGGQPGGAESWPCIVVSTHGGPRGLDLGTKCHRL